MSMALKVGDKAPEFSLKDSLEKDVTLKDFKGKRIILYFYPKDNTPGCTKEACNFKENWDLLKENNFVVIGISKDGAISHKKFIEKFDLPFILLTDPEPCKVSTAYDSYGPKKFMGKEYMGINRTTFIINESGIIDEIITKVNTKDHSTQILK